MRRRARMIYGRFLLGWYATRVARVSHAKSLRGRRPPGRKVFAISYRKSRFRRSPRLGIKHVCRGRSAGARRAPVTRSFPSVRSSAYYFGRETAVGAAELRHFRAASNTPRQGSGLPDLKMIEICVRIIVLKKKNDEYAVKICI